MSLYLTSPTAGLAAPSLRPLRVFARHSVRKIPTSMNIDISKLSNGLTVISDPMPQLESAALGVWVNTGGRNETSPVMGVRHMLEHMAFKGTERRTARQIAEEIEAVGGYMNAYTSREQTAFHM